MCVRWLRKKEPGWHMGLAVNAVGAVATGIVAIIVGVTKFSHGAWIICIVIPLLILVPLLGLRDKTIFLAARSEHYLLTAAVFLFPVVPMLAGAQLVMLLLWWGAATSKLNRHFPFVVSIMISNAGPDESMTCPRLKRLFREPGLDTTGMRCSPRVPMRDSS